MVKLSNAKVSTLNTFEARTDNWIFTEFEKELKAAMGEQYGNYQTAKTTIIEANKEGKWPKTVKRYALTNLAIMGNSPAELVSICSNFLNGMSDAEKKSFNL